MSTDETPIEATPTGRPFLLLCRVITGICLVGVILPVPATLRILFALPLVFVLPGVAVLRALKLRFTPAAHAPIAVGMSMAITVLGGLVLNCVGGLTPFGWTAWLGGVSILAAIRSEDVGIRIKLPPLHFRHGVMLAATAAIVMLTCQSALRANKAYRPFPHTSFWMLPLAQTSNVYMIGIRNEESRPESYSVQLMVGQRITGQWQDLNLVPGQTFTYPVVVQTGMPAQAWLYRAEQPEAIYRRVTVASRNNFDGAAVADASDEGQ